jgi:hypothetical protein
MKICICFYGLVHRSLKYTIQNIKNNILYVNCDIYIHTFDNNFAHAPRGGGEINYPIDISDLKLLENYNKLQIESEETFNKTFNFKEIHRFGDTFKNNFVSTDNLIRELYSIKKCYNLIENIDQYDVILMTRADLEFNNKIYFKKVEHNEIFIGKNPYFKVHDFFAYGGKHAMRVWANRYDNILDYCKSNGSLHAEPLVNYVINNNNIKLNILNEKQPTRVRACGKRV